MQVDLNEKIALVTGAGRGIGQAIAATLAQNGATVIRTDIHFEEAGARSLKMDVTSAEEINNVARGVEQEFGRLDILVNNAGVNTLQHRVTLEEFPEAEWDRLLRVDLTGLYLVSKAFSPLMLAQGSGRIINIASVVGLVPLRLQCAFVAAKAGVVNLSRGMALEMGGRGVLVNCIAPGSILTEGTRQLFYGPDGKFKDSTASLLSHIPLGRPGSVDEVAHAVLFLAAPESSYINGAVIPVDGGWTAGYLREF
ncbi:MAG: SDR family oxidoreductase [Armatimonadota bacterium]|nr:SDR family oxidoreductase [Armatimonadota bacterium]